MFYRPLLVLLLVWVAVVGIVAGDFAGVGASPDSAGVQTVARTSASSTAASVRVTTPVAVRAQESGASLASSEADQKLLAQYCVTCHNQRLKTAGFTIDDLELDHVGQDAEHWEKIIKKIRTGMMPPGGMPRPERHVLDGLATNLEARLDRSLAPGANLTTPGLHRLNRNEYANAIRDLFNMEVDVASLLPADGSSEGFDNIAEALAVSPSLIQGYVSAAMKISRLAVGDRTVAPHQVVYQAPPQYSQDKHIDGMPLGTRGGMVVNHIFPLDAEYEINIGGGAGGGGGGGAFGGGGGAGGLDVTLDGEKITLTRGQRVRIPAGPHTLRVATIDQGRGPGIDEIYSDFRVDGLFTVRGGVNTVTVIGPFNPTGVGDTPSRRAIFVCQPANATEEGPCAQKILASFARRAYRGPVGDTDLKTLMEFYAQGRKEGDFESGIQQAIARTLVSPRFIFRAEEEPANVAAGGIYRISDIDLASRLSFFLWSSIPDEELLDLATKGRLRERAVLEQQVKRMIADPKADALIQNFAGQWLFLRELANVQTEAKNFDENLRQAFRRETEMLFASVVRQDRSILDLVDADYTFVDERLARHYGIPDVYGSHFRRVSLGPNHPRRGLLGHGSMLTVTSVVNRTSPVARGKWVLEQLLGTPPPEPPPGVETNLEPEPGETRVMTLRQRLEMHRQNPVCASCHKVMDPIGFSLENFDLVGTWRERDNGMPIDSAGQLVDGTPLNGPADLRKALMSRSEAVVTTATEKLMIYALGRPIHYYDMPAVRQIVRDAAPKGNRFSALVLGIIESDTFLKRIKKG